MRYHRTTSLDPFFLHIKPIFLPVFILGVQVLKNINYYLLFTEALHITLRLQDVLGGREGRKRKRKKEKEVGRRENELLLRNKWTVEY